MIVKFIRGTAIMILLCQLALETSLAQGRKGPQKPKEQDWAELEVTVRGPDSPVENAQVYLASVEGNHNDTLRTDQNGRALFAKVPAGKVQLHVIATGWETFRREETLHEGRNNLAVRLERMRKSAGIRCCHRK